MIFRQAIGYGLYLLFGLILIRILYRFIRALRQYIKRKESILQWSDILDIFILYYVFKIATIMMDNWAIRKGYIIPVEDELGF